MVLIRVGGAREQGNHFLTGIKLQFVTQNYFWGLDKNYTVNILNELYVQLVTVKMVNFMFCIFNTIRNFKKLNIFQTHTNTHNFFLTASTIGWKSSTGVSNETNQRCQ